VTEARALGHGGITAVAAATGLSRTTISTVSAAISAGNLKVYAELAPIFARFIAAFHDVSGPDPERLAGVVAAMTRGPLDLADARLVGGVPRLRGEGHGDRYLGHLDRDAIEGRGVIEAPEEALLTDQLDADGLVLGAGEAL
jgi:hypothetical protein